MFSRGTIRQKLLTLTSVMALIIFGLSFFFINRFSVTGEYYHDVTNSRMPQQQTAGFMSELLLGARLNITELSTVERSIANQKVFAQRTKERLEKVRALTKAMQLGSKDLGEIIPQAKDLALPACSSGGRIEQILKAMNPELNEFETTCKTLIELKRQQIELVNQIGWFDSDQESQGTVKELVLAGRKMQQHADDGHVGFLVMKVRSQEKNFLRRVDQQYISNMEQVLEDLKTVSTGELSNALQKYKTILSSLKDNVVKEAQLREKIKTLVRGDLRNQQKQVDTHMDELTKRASDQLSKSLQLARDSESQSRIIILAGAATSIIVCILLGLLITKTINKQLRSIASTLGDGARMVVAASGQVAATSQSQAQGSSEQAAALEETAAALEEMASMAGRNSNSATAADKLMHDTNQVVREAGSNMQALYQAIEQITNTSDEMAKIVRTINEIAFQTNLLALNAAVEAARAGDAGSGFAVVADEVRSLALRTAEAAHSTSSMIDQNIDKIGQLSNLMEVTTRAFGQVRDSSGKVASIVEEIATASAEQTKGVEQINQAMNEMDQRIQQTASVAEESASAAEELNAQAESTNDMVEGLIAIIGGAHKNGAAKKHKAPGVDGGRALLIEGVETSRNYLDPADDFFRI